MKKREKEVKFRHKVVRVVFKILLWPAIKIKYRFKYKRYKYLKNKGPFIILGNHTVAMDPILMSFGYPFHLYYIASEQIFNLGLLSKLLVYLVNPISKSKAQSDIGTIRKARKIVNEGGSIGVYPEGNVTYDGNAVTINDSIVKLIRLLNIDVIIYTTTGLYFSDPRWSVYRKKGKSSGDIVKTITKAEYDELDNDELLELIKSYLEVNAYDQQKEKLVKYKGKNIAKGLERLVFMDLNVNEPFVTYTNKNELRSKVSDFKLVYDEYGYVTNEKGEVKTLIEINDEVKMSYYNYYKNTDKELLHEEEVLIELTTKKVKSNKGKSIVKLYKNKLVLLYDGLEENILYDELISISIQGKKKIIINAEDRTYLVTLNLDSSPYKYLLTYQIYKGEEKDDITSIRQLGL